MQSFQVPQYIEEESRLIGSLTFTQVIILVFGGALVYLSYSLLTSWVSLLLIILIGSATIILAFLQVDGTPTYKLIMPLIKHI
ncbi:MAG TPA: PrgI family protein [Candidatus Paceibacterota bacterium]|jgi:fatty acid desaturase|nr:PrgI family protein [Candidatus Paceibacterota bacterium]